MASPKKSITSPYLLDNEEVELDYGSDTELPEEKGDSPVSTPVCELPRRDSTTRKIRHAVGIKFFDRAEFVTRSVSILVANG